MAQPVLLEGSSAEKLDPIVDGSGATGIKLGIGSKAMGSLTPPGKWQGVATHAQGDTVSAADGITVIGGTDSGGLAQPFTIDPSGFLLVSAETGLNAGPITDISGTISSGGTSQILTSASATRKYLLIQNTDPAEDMWIDFGTAAVVGSPSILIPAGGGFIMDGGFISTDQIDIIAATSAHPFSAKVA